MSSEIVKLLDGFDGFAGKSQQAAEKYQVGEEGR